jgi:hypothetical protein
VRKKNWKNDSKFNHFQIGFEGQRGICAARQINGTFMNTALITVKRRSELMITRVVDLVLAHGSLFVHHTMR